MQEELELNRAHWDEATAFHTRGNVYGLQEFKAGHCRLHRVELEEVGDVQGKRLLHLQCHFGLDTLSWARRGASVVGCDFSEAAVLAARALSAETAVPGEFVHCNVFDLPQHLQGAGTFDIVYTSYGALNWLPDLQPWARVIAHFLKPAGFFYVVESHPAAHVFPTDAELRAGAGFEPQRSYFHEAAGERYPPEPDYADDETLHQVGTHNWQHSLSDIVGALLDAGLRLEHLHEFPYCSWKVVAGCDRVERFGETLGYFARPAAKPQLPLMFSVRATRPL